MPPEEEKQPPQEEIAAFIPKLDRLMKEGIAARMAARPAVSHYRLSRKEYQNTVYDLLGVRYDPTKPGELNEDTLWHGFERIGSELSLSPSHVNRYYRAAEIVLDRAFPVPSVEARKVRKTAAELRYGGGKKQQEALDRFGIKRPLRYLMAPGMSYSNEGFQGALAPERFGKTGPEDSPQIYEFNVFLEMPTTLVYSVVATNEIDGRSGRAFTYAISTRSAYIFTHSSETQLLNPTAPQMFDEKGNGIFSTVLFDWIEWEGPLETEAEKSRSAGLVPPDDATPEMVAEHLQRFAERAWRRPVKQDELAEYLRAYHSEREAGEKTADAYRVALQGVLISRNFIYLVEGDSVARERLTDSELASRLSYFLWKFDARRRTPHRSQRRRVEWRGP
jgi:hypothetical protein